MMRTIPSRTSERVLAGRRVDVWTTPEPARQRAITRNDLGRILQIGVHVHDGITSRYLHAGQHALCHTEPPRHVQHLHPWIPRAFANQQIERPIGRRVVHENQFVVDRLFRECRRQPGNERRDVIRLVAERQDHRDERHVSREYGRGEARRLRPRSAGRARSPSASRLATHYRFFAAPASAGR